MSQEPMSLMDWIEARIMEGLSEPPKVCRHGVIEQDEDRCPACVRFGLETQK